MCQGEAWEGESPSLNSAHSRIPERGLKGEGDAFVLEFSVSNGNALGVGSRWRECQGGEVEGDMEDEGRDEMEDEGRDGDRPAPC